MNEEQAIDILKDRIKEDNELYDGYNYINWEGGDEYAVLDGEFSPEELEAVAWWMKNKNSEEEEKKDE